jgi:hypothetical protein
MDAMKRRKPGFRDAFANQYGTGSVEMVKKGTPMPPATTPLSKSQGTSIPLRDEIDFMKKMQSRSIKK